MSGLPPGETHDPETLRVLAAARARTYKRRVLPPACERDAFCVSGNGHEGECDQPFGEPAP